MNKRQKGTATRIDGLACRGLHESGRKGNAAYYDGGQIVVGALARESGEGKKGKVAKRMSDNEKNDDFKDGGKVELALDDLEDVAGGADSRGRIVWCVECGAVYYDTEGHNCPEQ